MADEAKRSLGKRQLEWCMRKYPMVGLALAAQQLRNKVRQQNTC